MFLPRAVVSSDRTLTNENLATVTTNEYPEPGTVQVSTDTLIFLASINDVVRVDVDAKDIGDWRGRVIVIHNGSAIIAYTPSLYVYSMPIHCR